MFYLLPDRYDLISSSYGQRAMALHNFKKTSRKELDCRWPKNIFCSAVGKTMSAQQISCSICCTEVLWQISLATSCTTQNWVPLAQNKCILSRFKLQKKVIESVKDYCILSEAILLKQQFHYNTLRRQAFQARWNHATPPKKWVSLEQKGQASFQDSRTTIAQASFVQNAEILNIEACPCKWLLNSVVLKLQLLNLKLAI